MINNYVYQNFILCLQYNLGDNNIEDIINQKAQKILCQKYRFGCQIMGNTSDHERGGMIGEENRLLVGFQNKPLTLCYANSIFQVLFHHPTFCSILQTYNKNGGIIQQLYDLHQQYKKKLPMQSVSTQKLMFVIEKKSGIFERDYHQDCHEFFIWLVNQVNDQLKKVQKQTDLEKVFMSKRVTRIQCKKCQNITESEFEDIDLSLFLPEPNVSVNNCIQQYSKVQKLTESNKFKCDKCNSLQDASKVTLIKTLPKFLSIHLRRFKYDQIKKGMIKLNWLIPFPYKLKLKTNYKQQQTAMYKLVGVIAHIGQGETYGHYISYIKIDSQWYEFNDDQINRIDDYMLQSLWGYKGMTKCAYMLFYTL